MAPVDPNSVQNIYQLIALIVTSITSICILIITLRNGGKQDITNHKLDLTNDKTTEAASNADRAATNAQRAAEIAKSQGEQANTKLSEVHTIINSGLTRDREVALAKAQSDQDIAFERGRAAGMAESTAKIVEGAKLIIAAPEALAVKKA